MYYIIFMLNYIWENCKFSNIFIIYDIGFYLLVVINILFIIFKYIYKSSIVDIIYNKIDNQYIKYIYIYILNHTKKHVRFSNNNNHNTLIFTMYNLFNSLNNLPI